MFCQLLHITAFSPLFFFFLSLEIKLVKLNFVLLYKQQGKNWSSFSYKIHNQIYLFCFTT